MITHAVPNRHLVLTLYVALVVAALVLLGTRPAPSGPAADPTSSPSRSADAEAR